MITGNTYYLKSEKCSDIRNCVNDSFLEKNSSTESLKIELKRFSEEIMNTITSDLIQCNFDIDTFDNNSKNKEIQQDGRLLSAMNENKVTEVIKKIFDKNNYYKKNNLKLITPNIDGKSNRAWYDLAIISDSNKDLFIPINIKISILSNNADNLNCKTGMVYALTGKTPQELGISNSYGWKKFGQLFLPYVSGEETGTDYYFLIINKADTKDVFWNSLKHIKTLTPNGSNLPFQCNFSKNREIISTSHKNSVRKILSTFNESLIKDFQPKQDLSALLSNSINNLMS